MKLRYNYIVIKITTMTKGQMTEVLGKVQELERLLMRDLDESEVDYLFDHSTSDFLFDVLGFTKEDLAVLMKIRSVISQWCTRPATCDLHTLDDHASLFADSGEYDDIDPNSDFFKEMRESISTKVSDVLTSIINELQNEQKRYVVREKGPSVTVNDKSQSSAINLDDCFNDEDECPEDCFGEETEPQACIEALVPESAKKWIKILTGVEIKCAIERATTAGSYESEDELIGEITDQIKNVAIEKYVEFLKIGEEIIFEDDEIQSEVLDYLYNNKFRVKSIDNKVSLL